MSAPSKSASTAAPAKRVRGFDVPGMPAIPFLGGSSPSPEPKRNRASQKLDEKGDPAKGASPQLIQELPSTASGQASPDPEASPEVKEELRTGKQEKELACQKLDTASGQEDPGDAGESASAKPGEHEQGAGWGDLSGLGPDEEDATVEPLKLFPGFPRSVVYKIRDLQRNSGCL